MNPRDIMNDAIHNFHPNYQQYTQYQSSNNKSSNSSSTNKTVGETGSLNKSGPVNDPQTGYNSVAIDVNAMNGIVNMASSIEPEELAKTGKKSTQPTGRQIPTISQNYTEKTTLLSSDDEFQ